MTSKLNVFTWEDFIALREEGPETIAKECNRLLEERTIPVRLCKNYHDVIREDANWTKEYLEGFPARARMTRPK